MGISEFKPPRVDESEPGRKSGRTAAAEPAPAEPALRWDYGLSLGVEEIDEQHKALIGYCNDLVAAIRAGHGPEAVAKTVSRLRDYTMSHFAAEERFMESKRYPELARHRELHADMAKRVKELQRRIYQHAPPLPAELKAFLKDWLINHILAEDLKIAAFLKGRTAADPPPAPSE